MSESDVSSRVEPPQSESGFLARLRQGAARCGLQQTRVLVSVSGGPDSVALCRGLAELAAELQLHLLVAHFDHQLRGPQSSADADWVVQFSDDLGLPVIREALDVTQRVALTGESTEEAARKLRYGALMAIAQAHGCGFVAVGHTGDDRIETVLHHIVRGTGLNGLRGMPRRRPLAEGLQLVRPMLDIARVEVEAWLATLHQAFCTDATNSESIYTRNRIRTELLPWLEREFNPQVRKALAGLATQAEDVADWLRSQAIRLRDTALLETSTGSVRIDCGCLLGEPLCLIRETLILIWQSAGWPLQKMGFEEWQQLAALAISEFDGKAITMPGGVDARRRGRLLVLRKSQ